MAAAMEELVKDGALESLLKEDFDAKSFAATTIHSQMVGETLSKLASGITVLDKELYSQVVTNYEDLLSQATGIEALESVLKMMHTRIESLGTAMNRISTKIVDPYEKIVSRTSQLARLQAACDLLRKVIRMLYLMKRLKSQMQGGTREITKVAQTFSEIDLLMSGGELAGVQLLEEDRPWLNRARREVEAQAKRMLLQGLELMNPTQVGVSLQVFYNLDQLPTTLESVLTGYKKAIQHDIQNALDPTTLLQGVEAPSSIGPGRSTLPTIGSTASWKAALWTRLDRLANSIHKMYSQVHQLHVVLVKKRNPMSQESFLESIKETEGHRLLTHFWEAIAEDLAEEFKAASKASTFLRQTFDSEYPKLVRVFSDLLSRLEQFTIADSKPSAYLQSPMVTSREIEKQSSIYEAALLKALSPFEKAYISRSQSRLLECISQLFGPGLRALPKETEILSAVKTISSELSTAGSSGPLSTIIAKNIEKAIQLFNMKCDELILTTRDSLQVSGPPNHSQLRNITIVNTLHCFHAAVVQHVLSLSNSPKSAASIISRALEKTLTQLRSVLSPFVQEVQRMLEEMIESMHAESFAGEVRQDMLLGTPDAPCSGFMREMQSFTRRIHAQHLSKFQCQDEMTKQLKEVTVRTLKLYVCHICIIRPLEEAGKMRVTTDMVQIELALAPFCPKLAELGLPYRMLRTLRRLLFTSTDHLLSPETSGIGDPLPYSYVLNYLFSRAPQDMKSPHQVRKWSEKEYVEWMEKHPSEQERLAFIQATLDMYAKKVKGQSSSQLPSVYHIMVQVLKNGLQQV